MNLCKSVLRVNWLFRFRFFRLEGLKVCSMGVTVVVSDCDNFVMHHIEEKEERIVGLGGA